MEYQVLNGTRYYAETSAEVVRVLESARLAGRRVHLTYGFADPAESRGPLGRAWLEETDVDGTIGRSCGPVKAPILLANSRSSGGGSILDHCIVRITTTDKPRRVLYQHPQYSAPVLAIVPGDLPGYPWNVTADGELHARFKTRTAADRWLARME